MSTNRQRLAIYATDGSAVDAEALAAMQEAVGEEFRVPVGLRSMLRGASHDEMAAHAERLLERWGDPRS